MPGSIVEGRALADNRTLTPEFCIVGSGAAGGVCALKLAEVGFEVLVLEEGPNVPTGQGTGGPSHVRPTFTEREIDMYKTLFQEGGARLSSDGGIKALQGRCLGGGTTVNWSACLPPPDSTLQYWHNRFGLPFSSENLRPLMEEVVGFLHIHRDDRYNTSAQALIRGCTQLGYRWSNLPNNTHHCRECGSCGVGCPYDRKQSGIVTWLPAAVGQGATIYTDTKVDKLVPQGGGAPELRAHFVDSKTQPTGRTLTVRPKLGVLLAAGAVGTPSVLLRSKINPNRLVGKFTHVHPVTICVGRYNERTHPAYGVPDNMMTDQFAAGPTGYLIETGSFFPVLSAAATLDYGERLRAIMRDYYPFGAIIYAHHNSGFREDHPYGTTQLDRYGDPDLDYKLAADNIAAMRHSLIEMTKIQLAAGAASVYHFTNPSLEIKSLEELPRLEQVSFEPQRATVFTVHVMGGCRMGQDDTRSVVKPDFSLRGVPKTWVVDASIFPTGLGANPQVTIYSLALWAARGICEKHGKPFTLHQQGVTWPWEN